MGEGRQGRRGEHGVRSPGPRARGGDPCRPERAPFGPRIHLGLPGPPRTWDERSRLGARSPFCSRIC